MLVKEKKNGFWYSFPATSDKRLNSQFTNVLLQLKRLLQWVDDGNVGEHVSATLMQPHDLIKEFCKNEDGHKIAFFYQKISMKTQTSKLSNNCCFRTFFELKFDFFAAGRKEEK